MDNSLAFLHDMISRIVPIHGVSVSSDGAYSIDYRSDPTEEQISTIQSVIARFPLEVAKIERRKIIDSEWLSLEAAGWDSGLGYCLGITPNDVALISGAFALAKEAHAMGLPLPKFVAMDNSTVEFSSITEMTMLLLRYGEARANLASAFAARRKAVDEAASLEELESL